VLGKRHASVQSTNVPAVGDEVGSLLGFIVGAIFTGLGAGAARASAKM